MVNRYCLLILFLVFLSPDLVAQVQEQASPVLMGSAKAIHSKPLSSKELLPASGKFKIFNPKNRSANKVVPGKGYPKTMDAAWQKKPGKIDAKGTILTFEAANSGSTPTDPTGAVGPNHYVNAWNSAFAIYDKEGNVLSPPASLETIGGTFEGEDMGDPIVLYDSFADRFIITQFSGCAEPDCFARVHETNSLLMAISQGPDPVNDGWYTYRFKTGTFPDYPKWFVWSDGYYVTTNQDPNDPDYKEVVYVLERDKILQGEEAQHIGLPLPGANENGFYSPAAFNAVGDELPPKGDAPIVFFQDDAWLGVNQDHLKLWLVNVDWENLANSTIEESQEIGPSEGVTPFHSTFDGGSFLNLSQPDGAPDIDALQGAVMYPTSYRRFATHNSVVFNFVVDVDPTVVEHAGIRWYELRQDSSGGPWSVYQEGTYAPDYSDRWCGSIGIDKHGNIGLGFTILNDNAADPIYPSLMYTGRYSGDPLGIMTIREEPIAIGTVPNPKARYGDYSHMSIDPVDDETFWFIGEYFEPGSRLNKVGVFVVAPEFQNDVGIVGVTAPISASLGSSEEITVVIRNFGELPQSNIPVSYSIDGGETITETYTGTVPSTGQREFTFSARGDFSEEGQSYTLSVETNLENDEDTTNDLYVETIEHLPPRDVGITVIHSPETGENLSTEEVVVTVENFGGEPQGNFPIGFSVDGGELITETFSQVVGINEEAVFSFNTTVDVSEPRKFEIFATTLLSEDAITENDSEVKIIANINCIPEGSDCGFGDGIVDFYLQDIVNENIYCTNGYADFIGGFSTQLDRSHGTFQVGVSTAFGGNVFSLWIDFDDNAYFEQEERLISSQVLPTADKVFVYEFTIPEDAPLGEHLMRVRGMDPDFGGDLNNPCDVMDYGTTHDYAIEIVSGIDESVLDDGELIVSSAEGNIFEVLLTTSYQAPVWFTVHDMLGQKLVENRLEKSWLGYEYTLDMSYAATGVYLVRVGTREEGKVQRIIVH